MLHSENQSARQVAFRKNVVGLYTLSDTSLGRKIKKENQRRHSAISLKKTIILVD